MMSDELKARIRRRIYRDCLYRRVAPPPEIAECFALCPRCGGSGKHCEAVYDDQGREFAYALGLCPVCDGDGFVETVPTPAE